MQQQKQPETRTKVDFLFLRADIWCRKPGRTICSKIKKKPTFWDKPWPKLVKKATFWDSGGTINVHIIYLPLSWQPGDPQPLVTSQLPQKVSIQITLHQRSRRESTRKQRLILLFKRVSFLKNTSTFSFSSSPSFWSLEFGKKIYANFLGEIVTSWSVLDPLEGLNGHFCKRLCYVYLNYI